MSDQEHDPEQLLSDLGLEDLRIVGRPQVEQWVEFERDLEEADLVALKAPKGYVIPPISKIRASHHSLARCLALGMKHNQASLVTGYSQSRISILLNDATFVALVEDYRLEGKSVVADLAERMSDLSLDAITELQERLIDSPETFTTAMLVDMVTRFADRTGHGPNQEISLKVGTDFIDRPPRESFDEWEKRRAKELASGGGLEVDAKKLN